MASVLNTISATAQEHNGSMESMSGTGMEVSYNKSGGNISDYLTARATYQFYTDKHLAISANARYHFMDTDFEEDATAGYGSPKELDIDGTHQVYQFGVNGIMRETLLGKPFIAIAMLTSDFSGDGFERLSFMGGGTIMLTTTRETQFGLGLFLLVNASSKWPLFPMIIYRHKLNPTTAINFYGRKYALDYTPTEKDCFTAGFDIDSRTFYFRPDVEGLPEKCRYTANFIRPMLKYRRTLLKGLNAEVEAGGEIKMSSRIYKRNGTRHYMSISQPVQPFFMASLGYSL